MARTYTAALLARATAYLATPERERRLTQASRDELLSLYNAISGERRSWCPSCEYSDFFSVIVAYQREATHFLFPETVSETKYTFAAGYEAETLVHQDYNKAVTLENLTNEDAKFFLGQGVFEHVIVLKPGKAAKSAAETAKPEKKADFQSRYAELFGQAPDDRLTIAQLGEHIAAREADAAYQVPAE